MINSYAYIKLGFYIILLFPEINSIKLNPVIHTTAFQILFLGALIIAFAIILIMYRILQKKNALIKKLKEKSNTSPSGNSPKKKKHNEKIQGVANARRYELVTVLFSDIQGFTKIAEELNPEVLIDQLDTYFYHFDTVVEKYNIEKIKTIGDAYMCAGGIPSKNRTNPIEVVLAAIEMQEYMKMLNESEEVWNVRFGMHTGSVIAGTIGHKKLSYDIWGDTVNTASRMESSGEAGKINISGQTYSLIKEYFDCDYRGKMPVKYKGDIDMYFVNGIKKEFKDPITGGPNEKFYINLQLLQLSDLEDSVIHILENETPETLYYHNVKHAWDLYILTELYGRAEGIENQDMLVLRTAGLLYNIGYLYSYEKFEEESIKFAQTILNKYKYTPGQIDAVCKIILSGARQKVPESKMENVFNDALNSYIGRIDFEETVLNMYREEQKYQQVKNPETWKNNLVNIILDHNFKTAAAKALQEVDKETQLQNLKSITL